VGEDRADCVLFHLLEGEYWSQCYVEVV